MGGPGVGGPGVGGPGVGGRRRFPRSCMRPWWPPRAGLRGGRPRVLDGLLSAGARARVSLWLLRGRGGPGAVGGAVGGAWAEGQRQRRARLAAAAAAAA